MRYLIVLLMSFSLVHDEEFPLEEQEPYPSQGHQPHYDYPQTPLQLQHLDRLMTEPQPQRNPAGPRVHPTPGNESTLPRY